MDSPVFPGFSDSDFLLSGITVPHSRGQRSCPVCCQTNHQSAFEKNSVRFVQCQGCEMVFSQQVPEDIDSLPSSSRGSTRSKVDHVGAPPEPSLERFKRELNLLPAPHQRLLLDVGCANGDFLQAARQMGFAVTGIGRLSRGLRQTKAAELNIHPGDFTSGLFPPNHFDVITMWEILGQVPFPDLYLEEAFRILKPGGTLAVSIPNYESLNVRLLGPKSSLIGRQHINCFSETSLGIFLEVHGFEVKNTQTRGLNLQRLWQDMWGKNQPQPSYFTGPTDPHYRQAFFPFKPFLQSSDWLLGLMGLGERLLMTGTKHLL